MKNRARLFLATMLLMLVGLSTAGPRAAGQAPGRWPSSSLLPYWRRNHTAIYDAVHGRLLLFGGWNGRRFFNDLWALDLTPGAEQWSQLQPAGARPRPRAWHTAIYDAANDRMILFGGRGYGGSLADVWALDLAPGHESWRQLAPGGPSPPATAFHTAVYDGENRRMVVFAGVAGGALLDTAWALDLTPGGEAWTRLAAAGPAPQPRAFHAAVLDAAHGRMVVFGGQGSSGILDDAWALDLTPGGEAWKEILPGSPLPPARRFHSAVYDGGRMLVFGGVGSSGFLDDLWALDLAPGSETWTSLPAAALAQAGSEARAPAGWPPPRAWHSATLDELHRRMLVLGGFSPLQALVAQQWALNVDLVGWDELVPVTAAFSPDVSLGLQVEDAPEGVVVNKLVHSYADVVVRLASTSLEASQGISVTLTAHGNPFGVPIVSCFQSGDAGPCTPVTAHQEGNGRYTVSNVALPWSGGTYSGQLRFRFYIIQAPPDPVADFTAQARFPGVDEERDATGSLRVCSHVDALIVTNRTRLYDAYPDDEVRLLLGRLYELAGGEEGDTTPSGAVYYADSYDEAVGEWNNWQVDYSSESTANVVSRIVDEQIESWAAHAGGPAYLLIVGDDDIVPFYRQPSFGDEVEHPQVGNSYYPLNEAVSHDYYFTDNPYADLDGGWELGDLELAVGRIVGGSAADMITFLDSGEAGPAPDSGRAVVASVRGWEADWQMEAVRDAILDGPDNDLVDALRDDWGLDVRNDVEVPVTIEAPDWDLDDLLAIMGQGFVVFQSMSHAENNQICVSDAQQFTPNHVAALEEETQVFTAHHPFLFIHGCRAGLSLGRLWDESLVWSLARYGASGAIASAGLAYSDWDAEETCCGETLANQFWLEAIEAGAPADTVGVVLRDAKRNFDPVYDWTPTEQKTVQAYTLFGLPWMALPETAGASEVQSGSDPLDRRAPARLRPRVDGAGEVQSGSDPLGRRAPARLRPAQALAEDTYVVTATVDASHWSTATLHGFDVVQVEGMRLSRYDDAPVVPVRELRLALPQHAAVATVTVVLTQPADLGLLDIPTFLQRPDYLGGPPSVYTETQDAVGVYPAQPYRLDVTPFGSWQLARLSLTPLLYDAVTDQATLYQQMAVSVTYTATTPVAAIGLRTDRRVYLPGQPIAAWAWLRNGSDAGLVVTPTLAIADPAGRVWGTQVGAPATLPAGSLTAVPLGIDLSLEEGTYQLRFAAWRQGEAVAGLARDLAVLAGQVASLTGPEVLSPRDTAQFQVTFANARPEPVAALVHLGILDPGGQWAGDLQPQVVMVPGNATATVSFAWGPGGGPPGSYAAVARVLSGGHVYGPLSRAVRVGSVIYLPLVRRQAP